MIFMVMIEFQVGSDSGCGDADSKSNLKALKPRASKENDTSKMSNIALHGMETMIDGSRDFLGLLAF
jgi:hypothetical protein